MATWGSVPDRPAGGALVAVRRLRALIPLLEADTQAEAANWLETTSIDLIEEKPDAAIDRVRQALAQRPSPAASVAEQPSTQAQGLIADLLRAGDMDRAVEVTALLPASDDCSAVDGGLTGVFFWVVPLQDESVIAAYMAHLQESGLLDRLCPRGLDDELAAMVWLKAGDVAKALEAAAATGKPLVLASTRVEAVERRLRSGDVLGARSILQAAAAAPASLDAVKPFERVAAARVRVRLIHLLAKVGEVRTAERLASSFPGPGWRSLAYSVIFATVNRDHAGPGWSGPNLDLQEVPADD